MKTCTRKVVTVVVTMVLMLVVAGGSTMAGDSITGTISEKGDMILLDAADGSYVLEGSDQAPEMIGKTVKVTGTVAEKDNVKVIKVLTMEEVKE